MNKLWKFYTIIKRLPIFRRKPTNSRPLWKHRTGLLFMRFMKVCSPKISNLYLLFIFALRPIFVSLHKQLTEIKGISLNNEIHAHESDPFLAVFNSWEIKLPNSFCFTENQVLFNERSFYQSDFFYQWLDHLQHDSAACKFASPH